MFEPDVQTRRTNLLNTFYERLRTLSIGSTEPLNSRIPGSAFYTMVQAFVRMLSDAWDDIVQIASIYNPLTAVSGALEQVLSFFKRPRILASQCSMTFTLFRRTATEEVVIPAGAVIQAVMDVSGKVRSYKLLEGFTMPVGALYAAATFQSIEKGLVTTLTSPQQMEVVSGFSGIYVSAGSWTGVADPLASWSTGSFGSWVTENASDFAMVYLVQGRDNEDDDVWRERCFARWDEISSGATAGAYESWAISYTSDAGDSPVAVARVTENQVFDAASCTAPPGQRYIPADGIFYPMAVELAVGLRSGAAPDSTLLSAIGSSMRLKMPHTDIVWLRGPNIIQMLSDSVVVTFLGPAVFQAQVRDVVQSFFSLDDARPGNLQGLGASVYKAELIHAVKLIDASIENVKVVFDVSGKVSPDGDILLEPFDQLQMQNPLTAIRVEVA